MVLILSPGFTILAATNGYLLESQTERQDIIGKTVFDVFPDNPELESSPGGRLKESLCEVLHTRQPHTIDVLRYDIPDKANPGKFVERYWSVKNLPVFDEQGAITCLVHEPKNITGAVIARQQLEQSRSREMEAKAEAGQQRIRLERLLAQVPAAFAIAEGPNLVFKYIKKAYQQLFPGRQLTGLPLFEALAELKGQPIERVLRKVYQTGETYEGKEQLIPMARHDGQPLEDIYWNFVYQAIYDAAGQINGILIFALDVTAFVTARQQVEKTAAQLQNLNYELEQRVDNRTKDLKAAQADAERQKLRLEKLFMIAPAAICILDGPDMVYELVNPGYQQLFPDRQLLGKPILEALPEIRNNKVYRTFQEVYHNGITHEEHELLIPFYRTSDGKLENRYFRFVQLPRSNAPGQIDGVLVFAFEVTEQVEARKSAERSASQLRLITDSLPVLIGYLDKEEKYRFANQAYREWFNTEPANLLGKPVRQIIGAAAYKGVKNYINRALSGERLDFEATMPYRENFVKHIRTSYVPDIKDGKVRGFYTLVNDITAQVEAREAVAKSALEARQIATELSRANEELRLANQQLTHINADLDNFIYTASHDLRAPISNIEMLIEELFGELPRELQQQPDVKHIVRYIQQAIDRFKKTIANLTEITKLQKDNLYEAKLLNIADVVEEVTLDMMPLINESGAEIQTRIGPGFKLSFSEKNLRSIVYNLLSNAIKYRDPSRPLQVQVSAYTDSNYLVLAVRDNGLGLSPDNHSKLFSMFRRFHDHVEGSGVGLYMVKRMVDNAGGKIKVETTLGQGSTFHVYFPQSTTESASQGTQK